MIVEFRGDGFAAGGPIFLFVWNDGAQALPTAENLATKLKSKRPGHISNILAEVATAPGGAETLDFDAIINGIAATNTHADIDGAAISDAPANPPDVFAANSQIGIRVTRSAAAANTGKIRVVIELDN